jgi:cytochrome b pre-mRNA-processing protein 6
MAQTDSLQFRAPTKLFEPQSNPTYYKDLVKELEEAPKRSFWGRLAKRLGGMIRL